MVNSRQKGKVGEKLVLDFLNTNTPHTWDFTPGSGSGKIKGDLYIPKYDNLFCVEVKNYAESPISDKILTNTSNDFVQWWSKLRSQCIVQEVGRKRPLLFFKYNRSKLFIATDLFPEHINKRLDIPGLNCYIMLAEEWIKKEKIIWLRSNQLLSSQKT